jgi:hypothetical protein
VSAQLAATATAARGEDGGPLGARLTKSAGDRQLLGSSCCMFVSTGLQTVSWPLWASYGHFSRANTWGGKSTGWAAGQGEAATSKLCSRLFPE